MFKYITLPLLVTIVGGCMSLPDANPADKAKDYVGLHETEDRQELKNLLGIDPVRTEWCAAFVNSVLEAMNTPSLNTTGHEHPLLARSFLDWGVPIGAADIQYGDIVVFPRGNIAWQGHVGIFVGRYPPTGEWIILGGNQNNEVNHELFKSSTAIGIRRYPINTLVR